MARAGTRSFKRPRILVLVLSGVSALAVGAVAVEISRTGIDVFLVALLVSVVVLVERTVGDWFAELLGPGLATAVLGTCVGAAAWLLFSPGGAADRFLVGAKLRGYDSLYYRLPNDSDEQARIAAVPESSQTLTADSKSASPAPASPALAATSGVAASPVPAPRIVAPPRVVGPSGAAPPPALDESPVAASPSAAPPAAPSASVAPAAGSPSVASPPIAAPHLATPAVAASSQHSQVTVSSSKLFDLKSFFGQDEIPISTMTVKVPSVGLAGEEIPIRVSVSSAAGPVVGYSIQITVDGRPLSTVMTGQDGVAESRFSSRIPGRYTIRATLPHAPSLRGSSAGASVSILPSRN